MTSLTVGVVDVYAISPAASGWSVLVLQRAHDSRCPGAWETVHGYIEPGEHPEHAAVRELREETGLAADRLYNVTVQPFYLHGSHAVQLAVVFAAVVKEYSEKYAKLAKELKLAPRQIFTRSKVRADIARFLDAAPSDDPRRAMAMNLLDRSGSSAPGGTAAPSSSVGR